MRATRAIQVVAAHAAGEVGRVIVGGVLPPPGDSVRAQRDWLAANDSLRRLLIREPRGGVFCHYILIVPAKDPRADAGFIIMEPCDYPPMSGSNSICAATVLVETGMVPVTEPETLLTLEAPGGLVTCRVTVRDGKAVAVSTRNVACFADRLDVPVEVEGLGTVTLDLAYGGDFVAMADAEALGFAIRPDEARDIVATAERIKRAAREQCPIRHPELEGFGGISFVTLNRPLVHEDGLPVGRTATVVSPGKIDRSPTGTASSARAACLHARGQMAVGDTLVARSILDTEFRIRIEAEAAVAGRPAILPSITGRAWISSFDTYLLDPDDPFPEGYSLTDTAWDTF